MTADAIAPIGATPFAGLVPWLASLWRGLRTAVAQRSATKEEAQVLHLIEFVAARFGDPLLQAASIDDLDDQLDGLAASPDALYCTALLAQHVPMFQRSEVISAARLAESVGANLGDAQGQVLAEAQQVLDAWLDAQRQVTGLIASHAAAEDALGAPLFLRSSRGLALAPAGTRLAASLGPLVDAVDDVARQAADRTRHPVRVAVTDNGARILAARVAARLAGLDPPLELELITGNAVLDLARNEADLAVRVIAPAEPSLVRQRLGEARYALYASRDYLDGAPPWRDGGAGHRILVPSAELADGPEARWLAEHARAAQVACRASSHTTLAVAAEHGAGLCVIPTNLAAFHPRLIAVRRLTEIPERPVWLVIHRDARKEPRIRRVAELVAAAMRAALRA